MTTAEEETKRSVGVLVEEPSPESQQYDLEIKPDRPMLDVVQITLDTFFQRGITAPPVDLRPILQEVRSEQAALGKLQSIH